MSSPHEAAVRAGIEWLRGAQDGHGEFPSYSSSLITEPSWARDHVNFVTALTSLALDEVELPEVVAMRYKAAAHLRNQRERYNLWRYWSKGSLLHDYTPPDADDTACCSLAIGADRASNMTMLLANRDQQGRFYTWFGIHPGIADVRLSWRFRNERSATTRARRDELWANSEAGPDDVDVTVNANVLRYLGANRAPLKAVEWVASVVERGAEIDEDRWYRSRTSLYRALTSPEMIGIGRFAGLRGVILHRLTVDPGPEALRSDLERADALRVLRRLGAEGDLIARATDDLLSRQTSDGSWERAICYFGGPQESFGWASESLATAAAIAALHHPATVR
jgi:hypothetical protein